MDDCKNKGFVTRLLEWADEPQNDMPNLTREAAERIESLETAIREFLRWENEREHDEGEWLVMTEKLAVLLEFE